MYVSHAFARLTDGLLVLQKRAFSYRKKTWAFHDYPIVVRRQRIDLNLPTRFQQHPFRALILEWLIDAVGETQEQAIKALKTKFEDCCSALMESGDPIPRPGTRVPIKFATRSRIDSHGDLVDNFIRSVLHPVLGVEDVWMSDESSLWNFHFDESNDAVIAKIQEVYGVNVADIESGNIADILDRIRIHSARAN